MEKVREEGGMDGWRDGGMEGGMEGWREGGGEGVRGERGREGRKISRGLPKV